MGASFPHALGSLFPGDTLPATGTVFHAVRAGRKGRAAYGTTAQILPLVQLGLQLLIVRQDGGTKPLAQQRIGNKLRADARFPIVQQQAIPVVVVTAGFFHKGVDFPALLRRQSFQPVHSSSAAKTASPANSASVRASIFCKARTAIACRSALRCPQCALRGFPAA